MNIKSIVLNFDDGKHIEINDNSFLNPMVIGEDRIPAMPVKIADSVEEAVPEEVTPEVIPAA